MIHGQCPNCKTPATLAPGQKKLTCESCGKSYGVRWKSPQEPELLEAKRPCGQCGAPILIPAVGKTVTCNQCHTPHRIHRDRAADTLTLESLDSLKSPLDAVERYPGWQAADRWAGQGTGLLAVAAFLMFFVSGITHGLPPISIMLGIAAVVVFIIQRAFIRPTIQRKSAAALREIAPRLGLSPSFVTTLEQKKVDVLSPRGRQILDLYHTVGEKAARAVAGEQVYLGMTEGMVRLAWGNPSRIKAKGKGASTWLTSTPVKAAQQGQRMLWIYKTGVTRKVWFNKGRVLRAQRGTQYVTERVDAA